MRLTLCLQNGCDKTTFERQIIINACKVKEITGTLILPLRKHLSRCLQLMKYSFFSILAFTLSVSMMGFRCSKEAAGPAYQFLERFSLTPYKKVYTLNDTIRLQFRTNDKTLVDQLSN